jgi:hypothetical protein
MINYCYVARFEYITQSELNFIEEINKFKKIEICILNRNVIYNAFYRILVNLSFKLESYLQEKFHISRNYLKERLVKIDSSINFNNSNSLNINQWVFMSDNGFVFSDKKPISTRRNNIWCLLERIGAREGNIDQNLLLITNIESGTTTVIFRGKYEKDRLELNNKFISIRRVLNHAISVAQSN